MDPTHFAGNVVARTVAGRGTTVVSPGPTEYHLQMRVQRVNIALSCRLNIE